MQLDAPNNNVIQLPYSFYIRTLLVKAPPSQLTSRLPTLMLPTQSYRKAHRNMRRSSAYLLMVRGLLAAIVLLVVFLPVGPQAHAQAVNFPECTERLKDVKTNYPLLEADHFEVVYIDGCLLKKVWDDAGTGKGQSVSIWTPDWQRLEQAGYFNDFYMPGMYLSTDSPLKGGPERYATFIFRAKKEHKDLIKEATDFQQVWADRRSKADNDVALWELICPVGYVSLGLHAVTHYNTPTSSKIACIDRNYTYPMGIHKPDLDTNGSFWASSGTDAARIALFGVQGDGRKIARSNTVLLPPPTFWARKDSYEPPSLDKFRGLLLPIQPTEFQGHSTVKPKLTEPSVENFTNSAEAMTSKGYSISAFLVNDPQYTNDLERLLASPTYYVYRVTQWEPVDGGITCPSDARDNCVYRYTVSRGESATTTWNNTVGVALSQQLELDVSIKPLGVGAGSKLTLGIEESYSHEFGGETSTNSQEGTEREYPVRPGTFAVAFQSESTIEVYRHNDKDRSPNNLVRRYTASRERASVELVSYQFEKDRSNECEDKQSRDLSICALPAATISALPQNIQIYSESRNHYLVFTKNGTLEVRVADVGVAQHAYVWSFDTNRLHGSYKNAISTVSFTDGVLSVEATGAETWRSSDETYKDALLEIDPEGNLRIVTMNGDKKDVIWNSKYDS